ncbi:polysaccharide pyruvyl transferase family protein [Fictibacillus enclensis]|uniref:polysaccharide pyruvyl transferase family protein n=1 Tax=Fictibacillus enclensis TaxID=1017270 RepID=UPI0025A176E2|nr:polysaccharide pyruvyl transferase family protein [Fictibacillus enclensis]MDM5340537.1 polysaccharide pyruvyl transferase family protein [Fictibacillus enclensis]
MRLLLINAYSSKNRGDAGIVVAMIHLIRKVYPNAEIKVMSSYFEENEDFYKQYNVKSVSAIWNLKHGNSMLERYFIGFNIVRNILFKKNIKGVEHLLNADAVFSVGGGYLYSSRKGPFGIGLLNALFHIWIAKKFNKILYCFPQSVGPLRSKVDKRLVTYVLRKVDKFISREPITTELLKRELRLTNVMEIPDIGFTLPAKEFDININKNKVNIGITVLDWKFAKKDATDVDIEAYLNRISEACKSLMKEMGNCHFSIFPQVTVGDGDSDLLVSQKLNEKLGKESSTIIDLDKIDNFPEYLVGIYGQMDLFIGSRMHSTIFALAGNTPTISLAYQYKTTGTFRAIELNEYSLNIADFTADQLFIIMKNILIGKNYPIEKVSNKIKNTKDSLQNIIRTLD